MTEAMEELYEELDQEAVASDDAWLCELERKYIGSGEDADLYYLGF